MLFPGTAPISAWVPHRQSDFKISPDLGFGTLITEAMSVALMLGRLNPQKQGGFFSKLQREEGWHIKKLLWAGNKLGFHE